MRLSDPVTKDDLIQVSIGISLGVAVGVVGANIFASENINKLNQEKQDYVFSGQGGEVSCNKTDDPVTSERVFDSKNITGDAQLRQLLKIDIAKGACIVKLIR